MPVQVFRNIPVLINGSPIYADSASYKTEAALAPKFYRGQDLSNTYRAESHLSNVLSLSYPMVSQDILTNYISNPSGVISGNFAGYYFNSGFLKSYSLNIDPNNKIQIDSEIVIFDNISGALSPNALTVPSTLDVADASNCTFTQVSGFNITSDNILGLNYSYDVEISPSIRSNELRPREYRFGRQVSNTTLLNDSNSGSLSVTGRPLSFDFNCNDKNGTLLNKYTINGYINSAELSINSKDVLYSKFNIVQNLIDPTVITTGFAPSSAHYYSPVRISGKYFNHVSYALFGDLAAFPVSNNQDNLIIVNVPEGALTGPLKLITNDNTTLNVGTFTPLDSGISVSSVSPNTGSYYYNTLVTISGARFINVSEIFFGNYSGKYFTVSDDRKVIQTLIPQGATYGRVKVVSRRRGVSGQSSSNFGVTPYIRSYGAENPDPTNINGIVTCPSGKLRLNGNNFSSITGSVTINNITVTNIISSGVGQNVVGNDYLVMTVPFGNVRGKFRLPAASNLIQSPFDFVPNLYVSGIGSSMTSLSTKYTGTPGSLFYIGIQNRIVPSLMDNILSNSFNVSIGGPTSGIYNKILFSGSPLGNYLSGVIPISGSNGGVRVWDERGGYYENTGISLTIAYPPEVNFISNAYTRTGIVDGVSLYAVNLVYLDQSIQLEGKNLQWVTGVKYELFDTSTVPVQDEYGTQFLFGVRWGRTIDVNSNKYPKASGWAASVDGTKLTIPLTGTNYTLPLTGGYVGTSPFVSSSQSGLSGSISSALVSKFGLGLFALMSPYNVVQICPTGITSGFVNRFSATTNILYPGQVYITDFRDEYVTGIGAGPSYLENETMGVRYSRMNVFDYSQPAASQNLYLGLGILCSGNPSGRIASGAKGGTNHWETGNPNGFLVASGAQTRKLTSALPATLYGYGAFINLDGRSGWNWYATGTNTAPAFGNPFSGNAKQVSGGWGLPRSVYLVPNRSDYTIYLRLSGHTINTGLNLFPYYIFGDDGSHQIVSGVIYGY